MKNIDYVSFKTDLYNSTQTTKHDPSSLTTTLSDLIDKHATLIYSKISIYIYIYHGYLTHHGLTLTSVPSTDIPENLIDSTEKPLPIRTILTLFWHLIVFVITCLGPNLNSTT